MDDSDVKFVSDYIDKYLPEPTSVYDAYRFDILSYSRWAAYTIFDRAVDELFKPPPYVGGEPSVDLVDILEEFAFDMRRCFEASNQESCRKLFSIAESTADDILYFYIQERGKNHG